MKKLTLISGAGILSLVLWGKMNAQGHRSEEIRPARIVVIPKDVRGPISPLIFGASIEWVDNGNQIFDPARKHIRPEIVAALRSLHIPVLRFPGGILADYYHWRDGVGSQETRPRRSNPMDGRAHENTFGTGELIELCRALDAQPLITANFGTGSLEEAISWQKYFTDHGFPAHYWEIGNEIYLSEPSARASIVGNDNRIFKSSSDYATHFRDWASALRSHDSQIRVGAIAGTGNTSSQHRDWMQTLVEDAVKTADFVALHNSFAPLIKGDYDYANVERRSDAYRAMFAQAFLAGGDIQKVERQLRTVNPQIAIAITEHFPLFGFGGSKPQLANILDQSRTLGSALFTASLFHTYMRQGVWMATYNLAVSKWFGALLTDESSLVRTPTYYVFDLYRNHFGSQLINSTVDGPEFNSSQTGSIPAVEGLSYLDVLASRDKAGHIYVAVINRALKKSIPATIQINGLSDGSEASVFTLTGPTPNAINGEALSSSTEPANITPQASELKTGMSHPLTFVANSVTVMRWN